MHTSPDPLPLDCSALVLCVRAGDLQAYGILVAATEGAVQATIRRIVSADADVADLMQETYLRGHRLLHQLTEPAAFPGWILATARRLALNHRRTHRPVLVPLDALEAPEATPAADTVLGLDWQRQTLARALLRLDPEDRRLCDRFYHGGWSTARLAADAGISEPALRKRLERLRTLLRQDIMMTPSDPSARDGLSARLVELLARPRLMDLPEHPVGAALARLREAFPEAQTIELPEIVDLTQARQRLGMDAVYVEPDTLQRVDDERVLRYDLSLPMLLTARWRGVPLHLVAAGKVYRGEAIDANHLDAFHQAEVLVMDERERIDGWWMAGRMLRSLQQVLPNRETRITTVHYPMCSQAWSVDVRDADEHRWVEVSAWGVYVPGIVERLGGDPQRHHAIGAGYGLERLAMLAHGIDDIRKLAHTRG